MFIFDPFYLIFWIFLSSLLPGAILSLAFFRDSGFKLIEKIIIGFCLGFIIPGSFLFLLSVVGIKYSFTLGIASVVVFYLIALYLFIKNKVSEKLKSIKIPTSLNDILGNNDRKYSYLISILLVLVLFLAFWIRLQSYSPIYQELDPYYYTFATYQVLTLGHNPLNDGTSWYPDIQASHRTVPVLIHTEALWYSLYTNGNPNIDNYLLSTVAGTYPPIASAFAFFGLYLLFAARYKREYALTGAAVASFIFILILKFSAGEMEVQPFGFFAVAMSLALYAWALKEKDQHLKFNLMVALIVTYLGLIAGSSSVVVFNSALIIFIPLYSVVLFLKGKTQELLELIKMHIPFVIFSLYLTMLLLSFYATGNFDLFPDQNPILVSAELLFAYALFYFSKNYQAKFDKETFIYLIFGLIIIGAGIFFFTPFGDTIRGIGKANLQAATFDTALKKTIAEQGTAGGAFQAQLGFFAYFPQEVANAILDPKTFGPLNGLLVGLFSLLFGFLAIISNGFFGAFTYMLNNLLGSSVVYDQKLPSLLLSSIALTLVGLIYGFVKYIKNEDEHGSLTLFYFVLLFPPALVGIVKAKFTIYLGFFFAGALAVVFGELYNFLSDVLKNSTKYLKYSHYVLMFLCFSIVFLQLTNDTYSLSVLQKSLSPRFQDNPLALKSKLVSVCNQIKASGGYDDEICSAAQDPVGYASKGTNYQFSSKLCSLSMADNPFQPSNQDMRAADFRCQKLTPYWIETMEWIRQNTESNARITSWWDYGHWTNFFGLRNTVLRNEHLSLKMIGQVAHAYVDGSPKDLADFMKSHDSKYALFDAEIIYGGSTLGGKYGALNYLSCDYDNQTDVNLNPGQSECELSHLWETIYVPKTASSEKCTISQNVGGTIAYALKLGKDANGQVVSGIDPTYCVGDILLANGQTIAGTYYLNKKYDNGDLKINKAQVKSDYDTQDGFGVYTLFYTNDQIWSEEGQVKSGYEDRKGKFYDSNIYKAFFLNDLPGFDLVFQSSDGAIKLYKLKE